LTKRGLVDPQGAEIYSETQINKKWPCQKSKWFNHKKVQPILSQQREILKMSPPILFFSIVTLIFTEYCG
jgi:hypothetical protein